MVNDSWTMMKQRLISGLMTIQGSSMVNNLKVLSGPKFQHQTLLTPSGKGANLLAHDSPVHQSNGYS